MNTLFLRLIQPLPLSEPFEIQRDDLSKIKILSLNQNMFPLIYIQLLKYQNFISPGQSINEFLEESKGLYLKSITISMQQEAVENEIIALLRNRGISSVVIKGNQIAKDIYDDPNCRISSDIDILISKEDAVKVDSILSEAGYIGEAEIPLIYCLSHIHHASYDHPGNHMLVEIHWAFGVPYFFSLGSEEIWNGMFLTDAGKQKLSPQMILIMLLVHHHSHAFRELKILVDILWTLHKYEDIIDWHAFAQRIKKIGLMKTTLITLNQIQNVWKESPDRMKSVQILHQEIKNMGCKDPKFLASYFRMDIDSDNTPNIYKDKLIARFALDKRSTAFLSYFKTLFPFPEAIKELYKDKRNLSLPFNYARFIKWRVKEWMRI